MQNVKMTDIAKAAGVSIATVGRVIHNNGYIAPDTRKRVEAAIAGLGYVPNRLARSLKQKRSGTIGSLVTYNPNGLYQKINGSILKAAERHGYELLTMEGRKGRNDEERIVNQFIGLQIDALVVTSNPDIPPFLLERLHQLNIPVVAVERNYESDYVGNLTVKDFEGACQAVNHLIECHHTRIGLIAVAPFDQVEERRYQGCLAALAGAGIPADPAMLLLMQDYTVENGRNAMKQLWELPAPPTAVFATADTLAAGAMQYAYEKGIRIPEDLSLIGYDNVLAAALAPPIDSVDLSLGDIGETVLELIEQCLADPGTKPEQRDISTVYVDRGTVRSL